MNNLYFYKFYENGLVKDIIIFITPDGWNRDDVETCADHWKNYSSSIKEFIFDMQKSGFKLAMQNYK